MSDALKPAARRELRRQLDARGFTRERLEAHVRKLLRPRPRWVPKVVWLAIARVVIRDLPPIAEFELEQAERVLLEALMRDGFAPYVEGLRIRVRDLRAQLAQGAAQ